MIVALLFARKFLILMNCQPDVLDMATLYMKIYFLGSPIMMLNSFSVAVLRSEGDGVRPMLYSILSGAINVIANIFFVTVCYLTVEGVAIATVLSSLFSLILAFKRLFKGTGICRIELKSMRIHKDDPSQTTLTGWEAFCFAMLDLSKRRGWKST